ncbi:MAG TPA: nickel-responsive transcriptional regulator NikR [Methanomassiliicoccales archaeon]|nr:nickel-responsive transcriptional regulator NikR [Methanomassiliicoccales archaeon]
MQKVTRIGVSLEPTLLESFDGLVKQRGFATRSEAVRDLVRRALVEESMRDDDAPSVGTITLLYDHQRVRIKDHLTEVQHQYRDLISSSVHLHLDHEKCLEVLMVRGKLSDVRRLHEELSSVKGLHIAGPVLIAGELAEHG